jgi:hypothetical protein
MLGICERQVGFSIGKIRLVRKHGKSRGQADLVFFLLCFELFLRLG